MPGTCSCPAAVVLPALHARLRKSRASIAVICAAHWQGQGKTSGIAIDVHQFDLYEFRDGRVIRAVLGFRSKNEALEAAGLRE